MTSLESLNSLNGEEAILRQDTRGRVRVPAERREALLDEFEQSGVSAASFARMAGLSYQTFMNWWSRRRKQRGTQPVTPLENPLMPAGAVRLVEAVIEPRSPQASASRAGLLIELQGGSRVRVESPAQLALAAELIKLLGREGGSSAC